MTCSVADHPDCRPLQTRAGYKNGGVPVSHREDFQSVLHGGSHSVRPIRNCRQIPPTAIHHQLTLLLFVLSIFSTANEFIHNLYFFSPLDYVSTFLCWETTLYCIRVLVCTNIYCTYISISILWTCILLYDELKNFSDEARAMTMSLLSLHSKLQYTSFKAYY